jgi:GNAT superfamily N-acetyltransferase
MSSRGCRSIQGALEIRPPRIKNPVTLAAFADARPIGTMTSMRTMGTVVARRAELAEVFQLRWDVLRPGRAIEAARFPGDLAVETIHVGAFLGGRNIACATATRVDWEGRAAWQLRGMGVAADWQKKGVGQLVLEELLELVGAAAADVGLIWCNAREEAVEFYRKQGWRVASERFVIEDVGPHFKMMREL